MWPSARRRGDFRRAGGSSPGLLACLAGGGSVRVYRSGNNGAQPSFSGRDGQPFETRTSTLTVTDAEIASAHVIGWSAPSYRRRRNYDRFQSPAGVSYGQHMRASVLIGYECPYCKYVTSFFLAGTRPQGGKTRLPFCVPLPWLLSSARRSRRL